MLDAQARGVCDRVLTLTGCSEPANGLGLLLAANAWKCMRPMAVRSSRGSTLHPLEHHLKPSEATDEGAL
jgi:hypothetical protein